MEILKTYVICLWLYARTHSVPQFLRQEEFKDVEDHVEAWW